MGEPEAEGQRRVAPRHPPARLLLPSPQVAAGKRLQPAPAHPVRGRRREGTVRRVRDVALRHSAGCLRRGEREGRRRTNLLGGAVLCRRDRVHDCGRALPKHPSGVAVPLASASGRAGPGPLSYGGGGDDLAASWVWIRCTARRSFAPTPRSSVHVAPCTVHYSLPSPFPLTAPYPSCVVCLAVGRHVLLWGGGEPEAPGLADRATARAVVVPP